MKEQQVFHKSYLFKVGRSPGYMMVPFLGRCDALKGVLWALKDRWHFWAHLRQLKGYSGFTDLIKNLSIGVAYGALHTLVWIFEYVTDWLFAGPKGANFWDVKKFNNFFDPQILEFWAINWHRCVLICEFMELFFASGVWAMAVRVFWWKTNHPFMAWRVDNCNGMSFGNM